MGQHEGVHIQTDLTGITPDMLSGFFEFWPNPPSTDTFLRLLQGSSHVALAVEEGQVVGFVNALSDGVLSAYIPLLEVRREWRGRGIASQLIQSLVAQLDGLYMIDTACDDDLVPFYQRFGMGRGNAMILRNYERQNGSAPQP